MRDLEFLRQRPAIDGMLIYRYRSGALRKDVLSVLRTSAGLIGREFHGCKRINLYSTISGGSHFAPIYWHDWSEEKSPKLSGEEVSSILTCLVEQVIDRFVLLVHTESSLLREPGWAKVERIAGLVLDEDLVFCETLYSALDQFQAQTDLATGGNWLADPAFKASFNEFRGGKKRTLLELRHAFDERVAACTDPISHAFLPEIYRELHPESSRDSAASALRGLRKLVAGRQGWAHFDVIQAFDERRSQRGWSAQAVVRELYRISTEVLKTRGLHGAEQREGRGVSAPERALWTALLLSWDERLRAIIAADSDGYRRRPNGLVTALEELGRQFLARVDLSDEADGLAGLWNQLDVTLSRMATDADDTLGSVRAEMVEALDGHLRRLSGDRGSWLNRLTQCVHRAVNDARAADTKRREREVIEEEEEDAAVEKASVDPDEGITFEPPDVTKKRMDDPDRYDPATPADRRWQWVDKRFATVVGHKKVVAALRGRVVEGRHGTGIILHGPRGIGKRTLACIYARALLCERSTGTGEACKACAECSSFISSLPLGYYELDATDPGDEERARRLVGRLNGPLLAERCVVVLLNADRSSRASFDALLKTLEEPTTPVTFILVASDLRKVRLAVQSRCEIYRLRPLNDEESRGYLGAIMAAEGTQIDERVLDVLVAKAGGRVGRVKADAAKVAALPSKSLKSVRVAFDIDWAEAVAAFWRAVLADEERELELLSLHTSDTAKCVERMRALLMAVRPQAIGEGRKLPSTEPALLHRESIISSVTSSLVDRAAAVGASPEALWMHLASIWIAPDYKGTDGLADAVRRSRHITTVQL